MNLIRIEVQWKNCFGELITMGLFTSGIIHLLNEDVYSEAIDAYYRLSKSLHAPYEHEFSCGCEPPEDALFYFTEKGFKRLKSYIETIQSAIDSLEEINTEYMNKQRKELKFVKKVIDLSELKEYEYWYRDEDQICLEIL